MGSSSVPTSAPSKRPDATPSDDRGLPTSFNRSNMKLATLLLLAVLQLAAGFRVPLATPPAAQPLAASRMPAVEMMSKDISVSPIQAVFAGGGAAGVVFAAYCTSTGSPPTGLYAGRDARTRSSLFLFYARRYPFSTLTPVHLFLSLSGLSRRSHAFS